MEESWCSFRTLFTLEVKIASMDYGSWFKVGGGGGGGGGGVGCAKISKRLQIFVPWELAGMDHQLFKI